MRIARSSPLDGDRATARILNSPATTIRCHDFCGVGSYLGSVLHQEKPALSGGRPERTIRSGWPFHPLLGEQFLRSLVFFLKTRCIDSLISMSWMQRRSPMICHDSKKIITGIKVLIDYVLNTTISSYRILSTNCPKSQFPMTAFTTIYFFNFFPNSFMFHVKTTR